jgi:crotonobetainyl-CoA:carnitine CoA-transferase CaiB-like acyl-CoA transferase
MRILVVEDDEEAAGAMVRGLSEAGHDVTHAVAGAYRSMKHPVKFSDSPASTRIDPPCLGADTETILESLGL